MDAIREDLSILTSCFLSKPSPMLFSFSWSLLSKLSLSGLNLGGIPLSLCLWQGMAFYSLPKRHFFHWAFIGPSSGLCLRIWKSRRYQRQVWRYPRRVWRHPRQVWWGSRAESQNSVISLISPDFARFLQSKNQNTTVPHSMDIQCKKNSFVVQNMCFWCRNRSK